MDSIAVADITAKWVEENCGSVVAELRSGYVLGSDMAAEVDKLRAELECEQDNAKALASAAAEDERTRVLGIQIAAKGMGLGELVSELVADPAVSVEAAKARMFEASQAKRQGNVDALKGDEDALDVDASTDETETAKADAALLKQATDAAASSVLGSPLAGK